MKMSLHNHSRYSDGLHSIKAILKKADELDLDLVSITDHNEIRGSIEACNIQNKFKVKVLPGIEIFFGYRGKITEMLVYFKKQEELKRFYKDFIGLKLIPKIDSAKELQQIIDRHNGLVVMPHPKALKGCIKNKFDYPTKNLEVNNPMAGKYKFKEGPRHFSNGDTHFYLDSLRNYSELLNGGDLNDLFNNQNAVIPAGSYDPGSFKRLLESILIGPLDLRYLTAQFIRRKIFRIL